MKTNPDWTWSAETANALAAAAKFDDKGLLTAIALDHDKGDVLMVAHMNVAALLQTLRTGIMCYWSRSREKLWVKGETSGNFQTVKEVFVDCDGDAWIFRILQEGDGAACHQGYRTCFFRKAVNDGWETQGSPVAPPSQHG